MDSEPEHRERQVGERPDEPLLYLIGGNHAVQFKNWMAQILSTESESIRTIREAFKAHVAEMIDKLDIEILAEEFSDEAKRKSQARKFLKDFGENVEQFNWQTAFEQLNWETVLEQFGKAKGIKHRFCDPESKEKKALGIEVDPTKETESDWRKREKVWLSRIADCKGRRVLFVCGEKHFKAFAQLLENNGFKVRRGTHYDISDGIAPTSSA